jgi:dolichol-phosphate mannosyltransferase
MGKPLLSIVTPCYNEQDNIETLYQRVKAVTVPLTERYAFELIIIDNHSTDTTPEKLRALAEADPSVKVIFNTRNFGHIRSPYYGILQSRGIATVYLASDLQDPPELIPEFINWWEHGYKLVMATKPVSKGPRLMHKLRRSYYRMLNGISDITLVPDSTGFGLYDRAVLDELRRIGDPYPFLRGLICELGWEVKTIPFNQPRRVRGISKNNFYTLYDIAMLGIVSHSKLPIRIAAFSGFALGGVSILMALVFLVLKLIYWNSFPMGIAPVVIGMFFMFGVMMLFIGIIGEYIGSIHTYVQRRPVVVEKERVNFG